MDPPNSVIVRVKTARAVDELEGVDEEEGEEGEGEEGAEKVPKKLLPNQKVKALES